MNKSKTQAQILQEALEIVRGRRVRAEAEAGYIPLFDAISKGKFDFAEARRLDKIFRSLYSKTEKVEDQRSELYIHLDPRELVGIIAKLEELKAALDEGDMEAIRLAHGEFYRAIKYAGKGLPKRCYDHEKFSKMKANVSRRQYLFLH